MKKKLNIFFSNSISANKWGGGEKWMITAADGLKKRGHYVTLSGKANSVFLNKAKELSLETLPLNIYNDYSPFKIWYTKRVLKNKKVDIIVLNLNKDIRVAGIAARLAKVPVIIARNGIQLFSDKWKYKKTISIVDGIITNSKSIQEAYNKFSWMDKNKTNVIYNGLSLDSFIGELDIKAKWNIPSNHIVFVAAGRLTRQKGFDLLIEAIRQMSKKEIEFTVLIAGTGKEHSALKAQIKKAKLVSKVKLIGFQNNLASILKSADYILMPSRQEGMPNVVMEGMALGKLVLAANVNGVPELMSHLKTGYIFKPFQVESIKRAVQFALNNYGSQLVSDLGAEARDHVLNNFTVDIMLDNLESYFLDQMQREYR